MKAIKLFSTLFLFAVASVSFAQRATPVTPKFPWQKFLPKYRPAAFNKKLMRGASYNPLTEIDSSYDTGTNGWVYADSVSYSYYISNCEDSAITYYVGKTPEERILYSPWVNGNTTGYIYQEWANKKWENIEQEIISPPGGCGAFYEYFSEWAVTKWDTVVGIKQTATVDVHGNPVLLADSILQVGEWALEGKVYFNYDGMDTLRGLDYIGYYPSGKVGFMEVDTNFKWIPSMFTPSVYCDYASPYSSNSPFSYYETFVYDSALATYQKGSEFYYNFSPNSNYEIDWQWNGLGYDTASTELMVYDTHNNIVSDVDAGYDTLTHLLVDTFADRTAYTYNTNGNITEEEYWSFKCSSNNDTLFPCETATFSNFVNCATLGIAPVVANENIMVYPNPASDNFTIELPLQARNATVEIFNSIGQRIQVVSSFSDSRLTINTAGYSRGLYYVRVVSGATTATAKVVIE